MNKNILVFGATGKVGSEVVKQLSTADVKIFAGTRNPDNYTFKNEKVSPVELDLGNNTGLIEWPNDLNSILLMAKPLDPHAFENLKPFIDKAIEENVKKIVFLSAIGVDQNDAAPLRQIELYIMNSGINYTILRPNFYMENFYPGFASHTIKEMDQFFLPAEDAKTSFISVKDIASAAVKSLLCESHNKKEYTLTGSESLSHTEVAQILSDKVGREIKYIAVSDEDMRKSLVGIGMPDGEIEYMSMLYSVVRAGYVAEVNPTLETILERKPITFSEFAEEISSNL